MSDVAKLHAILKDMDIESYSAKCPEVLRSKIKRALPLAQRLEAALPALVKAAENFVNKCETGRAYSKESYREFKAALSLLQTEKKI